jgi:hypothetical protein
VVELHHEADMQEWCLPHLWLHVYHKRTMLGLTIGPYSIWIEWNRRIDAPPYKGGNIQ